MPNQGLVDLDQVVVIVVQVVKVQVAVVVEDLNQVIVIQNHQPQQPINQQVQVVTVVEPKHRL